MPPFQKAKQAESGFAQGRIADSRETVAEKQLNLPIGDIYGIRVFVGLLAAPGNNVAF